MNKQTINNNKTWLTRGSLNLMFPCINSDHSLMVCCCYLQRQEPVCQVPKPVRTARRVANRTAGSSSRSNQRASSGRYSTRAAAALDIDESAEEEAMATPSESEDDEEWSESSR